MKPVFAETSCYLAVVNPLDLWHERAVRLGESLLGRTFLTEYVLVELGSALSRGADRLVYLELLERLFAVGENEVLWITLPAQVVGQHL